MNMKSFYLLLGCCLLGSSSAFAGNDGIKVSVREFPPNLSTVQRDKTVSPTMRRVLNDDKEKGVGIWAVTATDYYNDPGFVHFYTGNTYDLEKTGVIKPYEEDEYRSWLMTGGAMHNGNYYGYMYRYYTGMPGYFYVMAFADIDLEEGTWETVRDMSEGNAEGKQWLEPVISMASNPVTGKLIGIAQHQERTDKTTVTIGEINTATGVYTRLAELEEYYFAIEYNIDGTLWAVRWNYDGTGTITGSRLVTLNPANSYAETKIADITMGGEAFLMYYNNTMRFERATGDLYILACNNQARQYVCKLDTSTGALTSYGGLGYSDIAIGMYIPSYTADDIDAPARVNGLTSSFDDSQKVTLMWTNPTLTWSKDALSSITQVKIFRDGLDNSNIVATLTENVSIGGGMTWKDETATDGVHTYYVVACNSKGDGVPDSWRAYTGRDVPGMPIDAYASKNGTGISLTWTAPSEGAHDGWFDKDNVKYNIVRYPDNVKVASGLTATSFTDNNLGEIRSYYYDIIPVTADGEGTKAITNEVLAGTAVAVPWSTDFATAEDGAMWTAVDGNMDGRRFSYEEWYSGLSLDIVSYGNSGDYAISPSISMKGGKTYKATFDVYFQNYTSGTSHEFSITAGQGVTAEAQTETLTTQEFLSPSQSQITETFEAFFTPKADGDYNIAFYYHSPIGIDDFIVVKGFSVEELCDKDLAASSFTGTVNPSKGAESKYTVTVKNAGNLAVDAYKVQIVRIDGSNKVVLGETEVSETLEPQAEASIVVSATPDIEGTFQMAAITVMDGDENPDNDMSAVKNVTAAPEGTVPFNWIVDGENPGTWTRFPFSFSRYYSIGQAIYHADDLGFTNEAEISRLAIEYNSNNFTAEIPFDAEIYIGHTDKSNTGYDTADWTPLSEQTKVASGNLSIVEGENNMLVFEFTEPFIYDPSKNLVVSFYKEGSSENSYPAVFNLFHYDWNATEDFRCILQESDTSSDYSSGYTYPYLPVLHLAVITEEDPEDGVTDIVVGSNCISYANGVITLEGIDAARLTVYDLSGRTVLDQSVAEGQTTVSAGLVPGVYAVKAVTRDGDIHTKKIRADK